MFKYCTIFWLIFIKIHIDDFNLNFIPYSRFMAGDWVIMHIRWNKSIQLVLKWAFFTKENNFISIQCKLMIYMHITLVCIWLYH